MFRLGKILCVGLMVLPFSAAAQVEDNPGEISVFATACERMINGESRASARIRAVDKASFKAVENIPELSPYKDTLTTHEFNLKVYRLVDNYLEDMKINSSNRSADDVCVEVSAYLPTSAVADVFALPNEESGLQIEPENFDENSSITIPPKPNIVINKAIAYDDAAQATVSDSASQNDVKVFVDKTEFYNGTSTGGFFSYLERAITVKPGIKVIAKPDNPDYILRPKVLKARVDNINSATSRLQIVVAVELTDTASSETITDHQNRFILFNSDDDAQKVASDLTRKLLSSSIDKLLPKIKLKSKSLAARSIITPN